MKTVWFSALVSSLLAFNALAQLGAGNSTNTAGATNLLSAGRADVGWYSAAARGPSGQSAWVDGALPDGAEPGLSVSTPGGVEAAPAQPGGSAEVSFEPWLWTNAWPAGNGLLQPFDGLPMHVSPPGTGWHEHYFLMREPGLLVGPADLLFACINLDPGNAPTEVALQWYVAGTNGPGSWTNCALWSADSAVGPASWPNGPFRAGTLPPAGQWVRLVVPAAEVGLGGQFVQGMAFAVRDGGAAWGSAGTVLSAAISSTAPLPALVAGAGLGGLQPMDPTSCYGQPSGLVGWWQAEGNAGDGTANAQNGIFEGGPAYGAGKVNQAFYFNGASADVRVPGSPTLDVGAGQGFTVEAWINPADMSSRPIVEWNNTNTWPPWGVHLWSSVASPWGNGPGCLYANIRATSGWDHAFASPGGLFTAGQWTHVAVTYDGSIACLYLNGSQVTNAVLGALVPQTTTNYNFYIGARVAGGAAWWQGGIDEVSLYSRALSASEISGIYAAGAAGKCLTPRECATTPPTLVGWWRGEQNPNDYLGVDNATWDGTAAYAPGEVGWDFSLNGTDADLRVPNSATINVGATGFTVEGWINPADLNSRPIVEWNNPNAPTPYGVHFWSSVAVPYGNGPGCLYANLVDTGGNCWSFTTAGGLTPTGQWSHVALTYDRSWAYIYLNGVQAASYNVGPLTLQTGSGFDLYFGDRPAGAGAGRWLGGLDEVSLYNQALTPQQIQAIFAARSWGKCAGCTPPTIDFQPVSQSVYPGANVTFGVDAQGSAPLSYQWTFNGQNISGATASLYSIASAQPAQAGNYQVTVSNPCGTAGSAMATLNVLVPATVTVPPASQIVLPGGSAAFTLAAMGGTPLYYQWSWNGNIIPNATHSTYTVIPVQTNSFGEYSCTVTNALGQTGASAKLCVNQLYISSDNNLYYYNNPTNYQGSGTASDPYKGDLRSLVGGQLNTNLIIPVGTYAAIHLGPGTYYTGGYAGQLTLQQGQCLIGDPGGLTILQEQHYYRALINTIRSFAGWVTVTNLTIDCDPGYLTNDHTYSVGGVWLPCDNCVVSGVTVLHHTAWYDLPDGTNAIGEAAAIGIGYNGPPVPTNNVVTGCTVTNCGPVDAINGIGFSGGGMVTSNNITLPYGVCQCINSGGIGATYYGNVCSGAHSSFHCDTGKNINVVVEANQFLGASMYGMDLVYQPGMFFGIQNLTIIGNWIEPVANPDPNPLDPNPRGSTGIDIENQTTDVNVPIQNISISHNTIGFSGTPPTPSDNCYGLYLYTAQYVDTANPNLQTQTGYFFYNWYVGYNFIEGGGSVNPVHNLLGMQLFKIEGNTGDPGYFPWPDDTYYWATAQDGVTPHRP